MKCREFKQPEIPITKSLSDMWESLAGALLIDGGWKAISQVLIPVLSPYIVFYYKFHYLMDLNLKGQALEILDGNKEIEFKVTQNKEGFTVELQIPFELCEMSLGGRTEGSRGHDQEQPPKYSKSFSNTVKVKAITEAHAYLVSLFK